MLTPSNKPIFVVSAVRKSEVGAYAICCIENGRISIVDHAAEPGASTNRMIIRAAIVVHKLDLAGDTAVIATTVQFLLNVSRLDKWAAHGWKQPSGTPYAHVELWKELHELRGNTRIKIYDVEQYLAPGMTQVKLATRKLAEATASLVSSVVHPANDNGIIAEHGEAQ